MTQTPFASLYIDNYYIIYEILKIITVRGFALLAHPIAQNNKHFITHFKSFNHEGA